jgi:hypothetical protein
LAGYLREIIGSFSEHRQDQDSCRQLDPTIQNLDVSPIRQAAEKGRGSLISRIGGCGGIWHRNVFRKQKRSMPSIGLPLDGNLFSKNAKADRPGCVDS